MDKIDESKFKQLIASEEGITLDFKKSDILSNPFKVAKTLTAFANTIGGFLLIGVCNDKSFEGLKYDDNYIRNIVSISRDKCEPSLAPEIKVYEDKGSFVYIVEVKRFETIPYAVKSKDGNVYFIRVGESIRQATPLELQKMFENKPIEKKPLLEPYFLDSEDKLDSKLEISPIFPIVEEKEVPVPYMVWQMKKSVESIVSSPFFQQGEPDNTTIKLTPVRLVITNGGNVPAKNVRITVTFPEGFIMMRESDLERPTINSLTRLRPSSPKSYGGLFKDKKEKHICWGWIKELGNDLQLELEPIFPDVPDEEKTYEIKVSISQNNYSPSESKLTLKVKPSHPKVVKKIEKPLPVDKTKKEFFCNP